MQAPTGDLTMKHVKFSGKSKRFEIRIWTDQNLDFHRELAKIYSPFQSITLQVLLFLNEVISQAKYGDCSHIQI